MVAKKQEAKAIDPLDQLFGDAESVSATTLADFIGRDPKVVRGALRKMQARDQSVERNNAWKINREIAAQAVAHFEKSKKRAV